MKLAFSAGIEEISHVLVLAEGKDRSCPFGDFLGEGPAVWRKAAAEDAALLVIKKIEIAVFCFQVFYMRVLHGIAPFCLFITVYAEEGK
ncbi:hypothetical protein [Anaerotignum sp.]|nr:hypothetical protein [Anaerotignum sp.]MBQ7757854.1 hypothetical protein [Anaerotignum sp.]